MPCRSTSPLRPAAAEATLQGTVDDPFGAPSGALALSLRASDAAALARAAGLTPPAAVGRLGALAIDGGIGGDLESMAIDLNAETAGATLTVSGTVTDLLESPGYSVDVDLAHPHGEALVETVIGEVPAGAALGAMRLGGKVSGDRMVANLAGIDATLGESTLSGDILLRLDQEPPAFHANLRAGTLDLAWVGGGLAATDGSLGADIEVSSSLDPSAGPTSRSTSRSSTGSPARLRSTQTRWFSAPTASSKPLPTFRRARERCLCARSKGGSSGAH